MIPDWMKQNEVSNIQVSCVKTRRSWVHRSLKNFIEIYKWDNWIKESISGQGWIQAIDPRVKLGSLIVLIITATLIHQPVYLGILLAGSLAAAQLSHINLRFIGKFIITAVLFSSVIASPAALNRVTTGETIYVLLSKNSLFGPITITKPGMLVVIRFVLRATACVSLTALMTYSTPWNKLLAALHAIRLPRLWIMLLQMSQRYLFTLSHHVYEMHLARQSRTLVNQSSREFTNWVSNQIGILYRTSRRLGEQVSLAMAARGFNGDVIIPEPIPCQPGSILIFVSVTLIAILLLLLDRTGR